MRLEPVMWEALEEICWWERLEIGQIVRFADRQRGAAGRTSSMRAFTLNYLWKASTEIGHAEADHGSITRFKRGNGDLDVTALREPE